MVEEFTAKLGWQGFVDSYRLFLSRKIPTLQSPDLSLDQAALEAWGSWAS